PLRRVRPLHDRLLPHLPDRRAGPGRQHHLEVPQVAAVPAAGSAVDATPVGRVDRRERWARTAPPSMSTAARSPALRSPAANASWAAARTSFATAGARSALTSVASASVSAARSAAA